jgi:hypothetical protein
MKKLCATLVLVVVCVLSLPAQKNKKEEATGDYFLLKGKVLQLDPIEEKEEDAPNVQVVVYQEKEIYVAFYTEPTGVYEFYLPVGHTYEIWYGGSAYVNKKVAIDATQFPKEKKPRTVLMDMGLFRPVEGYDFPMLNAPYVKVAFDVEANEALADLEYTAALSDEISRLFRKIKKEKGKKSKD